MFHTPPVKSNWQSETSIANSYDIEQTDSTQNSITLSDVEVTSGQTSLSTQDINDLLNKPIDNTTVTDDLNKLIESNRTLDNNTTLQSESSSFIESSEIPSENDLPKPLLQIYRTFLQELKEPKFDRSLASFEIAELFQSFYQRFETETTQYLREIGDDDSHLFYRHNLTLERLLSDKFYSQIIFPLKHIQIDDYEEELNDDFNDKLGCLSSLNINFSHLDIDLPSEIEKEFIEQLQMKVLPEFELFTAERSPSLKMKYLIKIHKRIAQIIASLTKSKDAILNTDMYLPLLIFTIIKLDELRAYFLTRQLLFIKRFSNEFIFSKPSESLDLEKGKLLYVLANFEAAISYLASVTLDNLNIEAPDERIDLLPGSTRPRDELLKLLKLPIQLEKVEEKVAEFKTLNPLVINEQYKDLPESPFNNWINYKNVSIPNAVITANQGIKSISQTIDLSLGDIIDKVPFFHNPGFSDESLLSQNNQKKEDSTLSDVLLKQLEENDAFEKQIKEKLTPVTSDEKKEKENKDKEDGIISKFTVSMGGVMKNLRGVSASSSSTSLNAQVSDNGLISNKNPSNKSSTNKIRSRGTSFLNSHSSIFGSPSTSMVDQTLNNNTSYTNVNMHSPTREQRSSLSILSSIENAFDNVRNNRSRDNSLLYQQHNQQSQIASNSSNANGPAFQPLTKSFEEMSISELREMYAQYQALVALHRNV
ncbi:hypothetical protein CANINC_002087 [Pichia inconspicua]|uniref:VPS9 domain-containing protein n=1 Tax=Pichia inconspicua TaxID=52247 RepID=A0A4T0X298_9ASCO|nr:hypothetical protein CANINC_002087 [[Candida] inconspicua]